MWQFYWYILDLCRSKKKGFWKVKGALTPALLKNDDWKGSGRYRQYKKGIKSLPPPCSRKLKRIFVHFLTQGGGWPDKVRGWGFSTGTRPALYYIRRCILIVLLGNVVLRTFINKGFLLIIAVVLQFMLMGVLLASRYIQHGRWWWGFPKLNSTAAKWGETRRDTRLPLAIITRIEEAKGLGT